MFTLDHIVINTQDQTDVAVAAYERLGFTVQPRGFHTLGSLNHLMIFRDNYLEFLGYPKGVPPPQRPELPESPIGLLATVLKTSNADATRASLVEQGLPLRPVSAFSRQVKLDDGSAHTAAFRVCRMERGRVPGTWIYYCQHETPHLVYRPEWSMHANGVTAIIGAHIAFAGAAQLEESLALYAKALGVDARRGNTSAAFELPQFTLWLTQSDALGSAESPMRSVTLQVRGLQSLRGLLHANGVNYADQGAQISVPPEFAAGATLIFTEQDTLAG